MLMYISDREVRGYRPCPMTSFPSEGLAENQRGDLSDAQRAGFAQLVRARRRGRASMALVFAAIGVIVALYASPRASRALRASVPAIALAIAVVLVAGPDAVARDLRAGRVQCTEGAAGKRRVGNGRARSSYFLQVNDRRFETSRAKYEAAPDAGYVRMYFLPRSRKIVNLELLPDRPVEPGAVT